MQVESVYKGLSSHATDVFVLVCLLCFFVTQTVRAIESPSADNVNPVYPQAFNERANALDSVAAARLHPTVSGYLELVNTLQENDGWRERVNDLYADQLYYSDTLMVATRREQVEQHFETLRNAGNRMAVKVHDVLEGAQGTYLVWGIQNQFSMLGQDIVSDSIGVTLFQFGEDGRIIMQQDFWDSTEGFYQHIPVLGSVLRAIRDSFATE